MKMVMNSIEVSLDEEKGVVLKQAINDLNETDPEIIISREQAGLVASWIIEAAHSDTEGEREALPIQVNYFARGPEAESEEMEIFNNSRGMIILKIDDDSFIEMSPLMAKRMRVRLTDAISSAIGSMFVPDEDA